MRTPEPTARTELARTDPNRTDPLLCPFLRAPAGEAAAALRRLLEEIAQPVIAGILAGRFHPVSSAHTEPAEEETLENVRSDIHARLISRLWELHACPEQEPIADLRAYVAVVCYRACDRHLVAKYPERFRLRNRLRVTLTETDGFDFWMGETSWLCGYAAWRTLAPDPAATLRRAAEESQRLRRVLPPGEDPSSVALSDLVAALFDLAGRPVPFEELVGAVAALTGVRETSVEPLIADAEWGEREREVPDRSPPIAGAAELRETLHRLFSEIRLLPWRQRVALLLNLRGEEGRDGIALFPLTGVATRAEIAEVLEMEPAAFADLWDELPLEDAAIAERLGCTRQQVIGLRDAAKRRLRRRLLAQETLPGGSGKRMVFL